MSIPVSSHGPHVSAATGRSSETTGHGLQGFLKSDAAASSNPSGAADFASTLAMLTGTSGTSSGASTESGSTSTDGTGTVQSEAGPDITSDEAESGATPVEQSPEHFARPPMNAALPVDAPSGTETPQIVDRPPTVSNESTQPAGDDPDDGPRSGERPVADDRESSGGESGTASLATDLSGPPSEAVPSAAVQETESERFSTRETTSPQSVAQAGNVQAENVQAENIGAAPARRESVTTSNVGRGTPLQQPATSSTDDAGTAVPQQASGASVDPPATSQQSAASSIVDPGTTEEQIATGTEVAANTSERMLLAGSNAERETNGHGTRPNPNAGPVTFREPQPATANTEAVPSEQQTIAGSTAARATAEQSTIEPATAGQRPVVQESVDVRGPGQQMNQSASGENASTSGRPTFAAGAVETEVTPAPQATALPRDQSVAAENAPLDRTQDRASRFPQNAAGDPSPSASAEPVESIALSGDGAAVRSTAGQNGQPVRTPGTPTEPAQEGLSFASDVSVADAATTDAVAVDPATAGTETGGNDPSTGQQESAHQEGAAAQIPPTIAATATLSTTGSTNVSDVAEQVINDPAIQRDVTEQVVAGALERARVVRQEGQSRMELQLTPPELGRIRIEISRTERGLKMRVAAESPATATILKSNLGEIQSHFEAAEMPVDSVDVFSGDVGGDSGATDHSADETFRGPDVSRRYGLAGTESTDDGAAVTPPGQVDVKA